MMQFAVVAVAALVSLLGTAHAQGQGCAPYVSYAGHTMCKYYEKACPGFSLLRSGALSCAQKLEVVSAHNKLRQKVANGQQAGQPGAANMAEMVWDDELATIAQRWADQCKFAHDSQRRVARFAVGQNIYMYSRSPVDTNQQPDMTKAVTSWFNEVTSPGFSATSIDPFVFNSGAGHYTQVVWADSYALGCGYAMWKDGTWSKKIIVCNYGPAGNMIGGRMYVKGSPNCPAYGRTASPRLPGLCVVANTSPPGLTCTTELVPEVPTSEPAVEQLEEILAV